MSFVPSMTHLAWRSYGGRAGAGADAGADAGAGAGACCRSIQPDSMLHAPPKSRNQWLLLSFRSHLALPSPRNNRPAASWTHATGRGKGGRARDECDECDASAQLLLVDDGQVNAAAVRRKGL